MKAMQVDVGDDLAVAIGDRSTRLSPGEAFRLAPTNTLASRFAPKLANWLVLPINLSVPVSGVNSRKLFNCVLSSGKLKSPIKTFSFGLVVEPDANNDCI